MQLILEKYILILVFLVFGFSTGNSQPAGAPGYKITGSVKTPEGEALQCRFVAISQTDTFETDANGHFTANIKDNAKKLVFFGAGYENSVLDLSETATIQVHHNIILKPVSGNIGEVVISGTLRPVQKSKSPVAVETFRTAFFQRNSSPTLFESVGMINGIRPQLNCNVCNTGDIHINGMEGPYTMILIDGMPIMSSLASVYGLVGIPTGLLERVEVIRGPASALYGSESMGGLINIITKSAASAPKMFLESNLTSWGELNTDFTYRISNKKFSSLTGINYFRYHNLIDANRDGFTDVPVQDRYSFFQKADLKRKQGKQASLALRYVYENRWGGQLNWNEQFRGTDSIYGESIQTNRFELIGKYELPAVSNWMLHYSYTLHNQNSVYGVVPFLGNQSIAFAQLFKNFKIGNKQNLLTGTAVRHTVYDDNTVATRSEDGKTNMPSVTALPGVFFQYEAEINPRINLLAGYRYDYNTIHKSIHSPRAAFKYNFSKNQFLRLNAGTGFRVVNLFTEEHAALTGDRKVVLSEKLNPEKSWSGSANFVQKFNRKNLFIGLDATAFYTRFSNKIIGDFDIDPNSIIYSNLHGYAISRGLSLNSDFSFSIPLTVSAGITYAEVYRVQNEVKEMQWFAPKWSGNFNIGYTYIPLKMSFNLSGMLNGPMRLPILPNDFRPEYSPWYCLANFQISQKIKSRLEWYAGIKNLLNFTPKNPLMRPDDPFDKRISDPVNNPNGYTFDTGYNYAPLQGRRLYLGLRFTF